MENLKQLIEKNLKTEIGECKVEDLNLKEDYGDIQIYKLLYLYNGDVIDRCMFEKENLEGAIEYEIKFNALIQSYIQIDFNEKIITMETNEIKTFFDDKFKIIKKEEIIKHIEEEEIIEFLQTRTDYTVREIQKNIGLPYLDEINF